MEETLRQQTEFSMNSEEVLAGWLRAWSRLRLPNDPLEGRTEQEQREVVAIYVGAVAHILPEQLHAACRITTQHARFFPKPADILEHIKKAGDGILSLEAQEEWEKALDFSSNYWHPDVGFSRNAPQLSPVTLHALRVAGGLSHLFNCSRDELQWARKRFIEDFRLCHETGKVQDLLADAEAKRLFAGFVAGPPRPKHRRLAERVANEKPETLPPREEAREVLNSVATEPVPTEPARVELSEAEAHRRIEEQKRICASSGFDVNGPAPTVEELLAQQLKDPRFRYLNVRRVEPCEREPVEVMS